MNEETPLKTVVITGSTRGIGYGLADAFLSMECCVGVSGRTTVAVEGAVATLSAGRNGDRVFGQPCDVTEYEQVRTLWDTATDRFGRVDIWINNAGLSNPQVAFWEHPPGRVRSVVETNVIGAMYGAQVALAGMQAQGSGAFYNMEGLGSGGRTVWGLALYGTTKAALSYLTDALIAETKDTPVLVGAVRPGMVITDLVTRPYDDRPEDWERAKRIFGILADRVETVTPWLARRILENDRHGVRIEWLTRAKVLGRFAAAPFRRRNLFD
jgi:NAD(P)-dependent dehydrogenase (short-subunit alcohol dehydrogenase family)